MNTAILSNDLLGILMLSFYPTPSQQDTNIYRIFHSIRWTFLHWRNNGGYCETPLWRKSKKSLVFLIFVFSSMHWKCVCWK